MCLAATFASPLRARRDSTFPLRDTAIQTQGSWPTAPWNPRCRGARGQVPGGESPWPPGTTSPPLGSYWLPALRRRDPAAIAAYRDPWGREYAAEFPRRAGAEA